MKLKFTIKTSLIKQLKKISSWEKDYFLTEILPNLENGPFPPQPKVKKLQEKNGFAFYKYKTPPFRTLYAYHSQSKKIIIFAFFRKKSWNKEIKKYLKTF